LVARPTWDPIALTMRTATPRHWRTGGAHRGSVWPTRLSKRFSRLRVAGTPPAHWHPPPGPPAGQPRPTRWLSRRGSAYV
jgi:hypothetical protein